MCGIGGGRCGDFDGVTMLERTDIFNALTLAVFKCTSHGASCLLGRAVYVLLCITGVRRIRHVYYTKKTLKSQSGGDYMV